MKLALAVPCTQCGTSVKTPEGFVTQNPVMLIGYEDGPYYELTCEAGHKTVVLLTNHKYDVLFQMAAYAINDGYYRDSVVTFTSSLERFYEFAIMLLTSETSAASAAKSWQRVCRQSERQLGAFIYLWLREFGQTAPLLTEEQYGFRNKVVHDGKIPRRDQAVEYGDAVLRIVRQATLQLKERFKQKFYDSPREYVEGLYERTATGEKSRMSLLDGTILRENELNDDSRTLESYLPGLEHLKKLREAQS